MNSQIGDIAAIPKLVMIECYTGLVWQVDTAQDGDTLKIRPRTEYDNQKFIIKEQPDGYCKIQCQHSQKYLQIHHKNQAAQIIQAPEEQTFFQEFKFQQEKEFVLIFNKASGLALDVDQSRFVNGTPIITWPFRGKSNQLFKIIYL